MNCHTRAESDFWVYAVSAWRLFGWQMCWPRSGRKIWRLWCRTFGPLAISTPICGWRSSCCDTRGWGTSCAVGRRFTCFKMKCFTFIRNTWAVILLFVRRLRGVVQWGSRDLMDRWRVQRIGYHYFGTETDLVQRILPKDWADNLFVKNWEHTQRSRTRGCACNRIPGARKINAQRRRFIFEGPHAMLEES